jgi:hypothetical protein
MSKYFVGRIQYISHVFKVRKCFFKSINLKSHKKCNFSFFSFSTQDGTAVSINSVDFDRVVGSVVMFNEGDSNGATKQISVSIIDDSRTESTESFTVTLSSVNGGGLVPTTPSTATVDIIDNDSTYL